MKKRGCRTKLVPILLGVLVVGALLVGSQPASAADSGGTVTGEGLCMQRIFIGNDTTAVSNSNRLNCTANDISIAEALSATCSGPNCVDANTCEADKTFTLNATFRVKVTANSRYDAGFFFRIDGGASARGDADASGECSLSWLTNPASVGDNPPVLNLDGDTCGDLNAGTYDTITFTIPGVLCSDPDNNGLVNLPNCTSWHSNQGTTCDAPLANAADSDRFDFHPDTKSKCVCDDTFEIPIGVRKPEGSLTKTATQADVTFSVTITNTSTLDVQVTKLTDSTVPLSDGDVTTVHDNVVGVDATCSLPFALAPTGNAGDSKTCKYVLRYGSSGTAGCLENIATATLHRTSDGSDTTNDVDVVGSTTINVGLNVGACPSP